MRGRLKRESNPMPGEIPGFTPQHDNTGNNDFVNTSPVNPLPVNDVNIRAELQQIKQQQQQILTRLNEPINTQLTGSNVEDVESWQQEIIFNRQIRSSSTSYTQIDFPKGAKNVILFFRIYGVTGTFDAEQGVNLEAGLNSPNRAAYIGIATRTNRTTSSNQEYVISDLPTEENSRIATSNFLLPRFTTRIDIRGTFASGEGIDCDVVAVWVS